MNANNAQELSFVDQLIQAVSVSQELLAESANAKKCIDALSAIETESELVKVTLWKLNKLSGNNKKGAVEALEFLIPAAQAVLEEDAKNQAPSRLAEIEEEILKHHSVAANALLTIGKLLNEAREEFSKAKEFLVWAEDKFGYKKAYVYRLMAAAEKFGDNPAFEGVAIKVLTIIAGLPEEVQKQAEELAEKGQLDTAKAQELQAEANPAPEQEKPAQAKAGPAVSTRDTAGAPWDEQSSASEGFDEEPDFAPAPVSVVLPEVKTEAPAELSDLNPADLQALIRSLQEQLREAKAAAIKKPELPWLPQFDNECLAARLGLSEAQGLDAKQARKAYRDLVKIGYGVEHPANAKLQEALQYLLGQREAA